MKQNDIILVAVCVVVGGTFSLVISNMLFGSSKRQEKVEVVEKITSEFIQPSSKYFNATAINPTHQIQIDNNSTPIQFGQ
jgi:hypothetical protein